MPSLLDDPYADPGQSRPAGLLGLDMPRIGQPDPDTDQGAALAATYKAITDEMARQRTPGRGLVDAVMTNPVGTETTQSMRSATPIDQIAFMRPDGTPVMASDMARAHQQVQQAMQVAPTMALGMMGTTDPVGSGGGFSLEKVQRRPTAPQNEHIWKIKDPAGGDAGTIDTTWNPDTGNLHIEDFQSEGGPNTLGLTAIRQLHGALLDQYPGVQTLSGLRISGATYAHKNSGAGPGRYAIQNLKPEQ